MGELLSQRQRFIVILGIIVVAFCALVVVPLVRYDQSDQLDQLLARSKARTVTFNQIQDAQREIQTTLLRILAKLEAGAP